MMTLVTGEIGELGNTSCGTYDFYGVHTKYEYIYGWTAASSIINLASRVIGLIDAIVPQILEYGVVVPRQSHSFGSSKILSRWRDIVTLGADVFLR
jgi:hypothetical protein